MIFVLLLVSVIAQSIAALIAFQQMRETGRYRLAWACVSLALALMVERRFAPLLRYGDNVVPNTLDSVFGFLISIFMLVGLWGIRKLFSELQKQEEVLSAQASTDALTGLANRRETLQRLHFELDRLIRNQRPVSLIMLDLDHFKKVNDTWGHAAGDAVLCAVATVCKNSIRHIDLAGRWGGEEFLIILPEADSEDARVAAERLRVAIADTKIPVGDAVLTINASIGVVTSDSEIQAESLIGFADEALYDAKNNGRNRVSIFARPL